MSLFRLLRSYLDANVQAGNLTVIDADDVAHRFGDGTGVPVVVRLRNSSLYWKLSLAADPYSGEAFMDGSLVMEEGSIYDLMVLLAEQNDPCRTSGWNRLRFGLRHRSTIPLGRAQRNVAHHYDLSQQFFELFLDRDMQYSCAYFPDRSNPLNPPDQPCEAVSLEQAQFAKKQHIASKLALEPGMTVLDIGCGWGGLALYLAQTYQVRVVGITLSERQHKRACAECARLELQHLVDFRLIDYRNLNERFDRIVSVGMFEHVGLAHYDEFFAKIQQLLSADGAALLHTIARLHGPNNTSRWITKYIFPDGKIPALSEIAAPVERLGLHLCDLEVLRLHYAMTLRQWRHRFLANRKQAAQLYDDRFCRMWEFYLASSEVAFRYQGLSIFQLQFSNRMDALPLTRRFMTDEEERLIQVAGIPLPR